MARIEAADFCHTKTLNPGLCLGSGLYQNMAAYLIKLKAYGLTDNLLT